MKDNDSNNYLNTLAKTYIRSLGIGVILIVGFLFYALYALFVYGNEVEFLIIVSLEILVAIIATIIQIHHRRKKEQAQKNGEIDFDNIDDLLK